MSGRIVFGFGLGIAAIAAAPYAVPVIAAVGRPLFKGVIKQTLLGIDRARLSVARFAETVEDMLAEVRSEVDDDRGAIRGESVGFSVATSGNNAQAE